MTNNRLIRLLCYQCSLIVVMSMTGCVLDQDRQSLTSVFEGCDSCHAIEPRFKSNAPVLDGLPERYLEEQMHNFASGMRGAESSDQFTHTMINQLQALEPGQFRSLARDYARKRDYFSFVTVDGDSSRGEPLFQENCRSCHISPVGRLFTGSPPVTQLGGPYIVAQLRAFAADQRSFTEENSHKLKMAQLSKQLSQQDILDVTAFIKSRFADNHPRLLLQ